jgi:hypothetical protein
VTKRLSLLALAIFNFSACSEVETNKTAIVDDSIIVGASPESFRSPSESRWSIEVWNGPSITGDPADNGYFLPDADTVLLEIVAECKLGTTYRNQATDGILMLAIGNANLTAEQLRCVHLKERRGLRLVESKPKS